MTALLHSRFAETLGWTLLHSLWQLSLIAALSAAALALLPRASAQLRYVVACCGLLAMLATPVGTFVHLLPPAPPAHVAALDVPGEVTLTAAPANLAITVPESAASPTPAPPPPLAQRLERAVTPWLPDAVGCYLLGCGLMLVRLLLGYTRLRRIVATAAPLHGRIAGQLHDLARRMGVNATVRLLQSAAIEVPTLIGTLKPVILLPAAALTGLTPEQLSALLAHELAHIRRHDYLANLIQSLIDTLLFYHPAVWWLSARIRAQRELCCDDAAIAATSDPLAYARALAAMESLRAAPTLALAARGSGPLLTRIRRVLATPAPTPPRRFLSATAALLLIASASLAYLGCNASLTNSTLISVSSSSATQPIIVEASVFSVPTTLLQNARVPWNLSLAAQIKDNGKSQDTTFKAARLSASTQGPLLASLLAGPHTNIMSGGHLALRDGRAAVMDDRRSHQYVKSTKILVGANGAPGMQPEFATVFDGMLVDVTAKRYGNSITLALHPTYSRLDGIDTFSVPVPDGSPPATLEPYMQLPKTTVCEFTTTATIPEDGTLFIAGPVLPVETVVEIKTPLLSQLPLVGGAFTNRRYVSEKQTLIFVIQAGTPTLGGKAADNRDGADTAIHPSSQPGLGQVLINALLVEGDADLLTKALADIDPGFHAGTQPAFSTRNGLDESAVLKTLKPLIDAKKVEVLSRPRVLVNDGQNAQITIGNQQNYIKNIQVDTNGKQNLDVATLFTGIKLGITPYVKNIPPTFPEDTPYDPGVIKLTVEASMTDLIRFENKPAPKIPAGGATSPSTRLAVPTATSTAPAAVASATGPWPDNVPIQVPIVDRRQASASLHVLPDHTVVMSLVPAKPGKLDLIFLTPHIAPTTSAPASRE